MKAIGMKRVGLLVAGVSIMALTGMDNAHAASAAADAGEEVLSIKERPRPDYNADGVRAGSFILRPSAEVAVLYDDNIFRTDTATESDYIKVVEPGISAISNWNNHELRFDANAELGFYGENESENYQDYGAGVSGRIDILRETYVTLGTRFEELHEDRGSPDDVNGEEPTQYSIWSNYLGFTRALGRLSLEVAGDHQKLNFDDVSANGITIDNDDRDRDHYQGLVKLGYEFIPNYQAFVQASYNLRRYDFTPAIHRDSDGYNVVAGTSIDFSGKLRGEAYIGYMAQNYEVAAYEDIDAVNYGGSLLWNATQLTSFRAGVRRFTRETTVIGASGYISTIYSASVEHELLRQLVLGADANFITNDYQGGVGGVERNDDLIDTGLDLKYFLRRGVAVGASYRYVERDSNLPGQDYDNNRFLITAGVAM